MNQSNFNTEWIKIGGASKDFVEFADRFGKQLKEGKLTSSQFRNFYSTLKTIEMKGFEKTKTKFYMLKPLLAYGQARQKNDGYRDFKRVMDQCLDFIMESDKTEQEKYFKNFCRIVEAILAYHKAHGGN